MIKSCVIGLSKVGKIHCESLFKLKKTSLNYVFDTNHELSKSVSKKFKCKTSKNFDEIIKKSEIKLFIISSPTSTHEYYIKKLIKYKKIIYCEKPILKNNKNLKKIYNLIKKNKIKFCVGLNRRFAKEYVHLKNILNRKRVKIIQIISKSANHNINLSTRNGGLFFDKGFHFFDLACWLGKSIPHQMIVISRSISSNDFLKKNDFSDAIINMKLKNGVNVEMIFSRKNREGNLENVKVYGDKFFTELNKYADKKNLHKDFSIRYKNSYIKCLKKFLDNEKNLLLKEGLLTQKICAEALSKAKIQ